MKRSEAVELILSKMQHLDLVTEVDRVGGSTSEVNQVAYSEASQLLEFIEELGMLPPKTKLNALNIEDNAWEPEDG
jgi:hypothetical protein